MATGHASFWRVVLLGEKGLNWRDYTKEVAMQPNFKKSIQIISTAMTTCLLATAAQSADCEKYYYGTDRVEAVNYCSSSHLRPSKVAPYGPGNAEPFEESNRKLAWCEGAKGDGINQWLQLSILNGSAFVKTLTIANGYQKSKTAFYANARAKKIRIEMDSGLQVTTTLKDRFGDQVLTLPDWQDITKVRVTILSVYPGEKYQDTCLTTLALSFTEGADYEWEQMQAD